MYVGGSMAAMLNVTELAYSPALNKITTHLQEAGLTAAGKLNVFTASAGSDERTAGLNYRHPFHQCADIKFILPNCVLMTVLRHYYYSTAILLSHTCQRRRREPEPLCYGGEHRGRLLRKPCEKRLTITSGLTERELMAAGT